ncbi:hypothetical protein M011DRAFT_101068 [Sporormia fimetaria CBS 119925]|uniref:Uncharacterized protein n=1 Tax=Sporormia fimetaria CBS 119925 TaxID=1340428 RepID=A0A6A6VMX6_9PLEO|nr:hypothetical protein M011DRAFT_101068 [Sporormia fimetaria CBS 119925]
MSTRPTVCPMSILYIRSFALTFPRRDYIWPFPATRCCSSCKTFRSKAAKPEPEMRWAIERIVDVGFEFLDLLVLFRDMLLMVERAGENQSDHRVQTFFGDMAFAIKAMRSLPPPRTTKGGARKRPRSTSWQLISGPVILLFDVLWGALRQRNVPCLRSERK